MAPARPLEAAPSGSRLRRWIDRPRVALAACGFVACVWLDQGPSARRYDAIAREVDAGGHALLALWRPLAFAYRRAQDEELYYAVADALRGAPFDAGVLLRERGEASAAFRRYPEADGRWHVPYRDVPLEYPALLLPFVIAPAWVSPSFDVFARLFGASMGSLLVLAVAVAVGAQAGLGPRARARRYQVAALLFLAQGGLLVQRLDAVPALLLAVALWAAARRRPWTLGLAIGLAGAAKLLPLVVLLPILAADREPSWPAGKGSRSGRDVGRVVAGAAAGFLGGFVAPMLLLSPSGLGEMLAYHASRGLQIESTYAALLSVVDLVSGHPARATLSFGSYNLDGPAANAMARLASPLVALSVVGLTVWLARLPSPRAEEERVDRIASAGLLALLSAWLFGKVFSPQYMTWAIPFVLALATPRRRWIAASLLLAMAIAQAYLRGFYDHVAEMRPLGVCALVARLGALVVLAALVARAARAGAETARATPPG